MSSSNDAPTKIITLDSHDKRVRLTTPTSADDEQSAIIRSDPEALRYLRFMKPQDTAAIAQRRESRAKDPRILDFNVFLPPPGGFSEDGSDPEAPRGELIGMSGVFNMDDFQNSCEAGIILAPKTHGTGLATVVLYTLLKYIFEERGFHRVTWETAADNLPMKGWLEKCGARCEATRLEAWTDGNGGRTDVSGYAMLRLEWDTVIKKYLEKRMGLVSE